MYKKLYITSLLAAALLAGCKKDLENVSDPALYSTSNFPATLADLQSTLAPAYSNLRDQDLFGFHLLPKALSNATHTANSAYGGDASWNEMANTNLSVTNQYSTEAYTALYTGVKNCNVALAGADAYMAKSGKAGDQQTVDYIKGQAYFLRAYYYFQLECLFGESYITTAGGGDKMGVPIYNGIPGDLASTQVARSTARQVWDLIEGDLKQSATLLKGKIWSGDDRGRVSEWAAKGLLGKAYVFTQDWTNAKTTLLDVIQNSGKTLMPFSKYADAFDGNSANEFNEESLFELNVDMDAKGNDYGIYGGKVNATTINGLIWPAWALGADGTEGGASPLGYGNEIVHDRNVPRFGFNIGYYNLVPNPAYTGSNPSYKNPQQIMDPAYRAKALAVRANKTADPRLFVNTVEPWIDEVKPDGTTVYPASKPNFYAGQVNTYGFSFRKYSPVNFNINNNGPADGWNLYLLRLADVYLLYAEACKGAGDNVNALEYLNKVKRRAYDLPINAASAIDYKSLTDQTPAAVANDPVLGNNPLYYERFAELFNEGHWWYDVCRWRIGKSEATFYGTALNLSGPIQWDDNKSYVWPIPLAEINSNSKIKQNPGY